MKNKEPNFKDTVTRQYQNSQYEKTDSGWVKKIEEQKNPTPESNGGQRPDYTDEQLAEYAKKASDESLRKAGSGRDERMRIAAKKELLRRKNEGMPEPEKSDNPFDEGLEKGWFDEFPTRKFAGKDYINKGQGWEPLEKGKRAEIGEIRTWSGEKYQRTDKGWKYIGKASGGGKSEKEGSEKKNNQFEKEPEFVLRGKIDPINDKDWEKKASEIDWKYADMASIGQTVAYLGKVDDSDKPYAVKYYSPNGKNSDVMRLTEADYKKNLERDKKIQKASESLGKKE